MLKNCVLRNFFLFVSLLAVPLVAQAGEINNIVENFYQDKPVIRKYEIEKSTYKNSFDRCERAVNSLLEIGTFYLNRDKLMRFEFQSKATNGGAVYYELMNESNKTQHYLGLNNDFIALLPYGEYSIKTFLLAPNDDTKAESKIKIDSQNLNIFFQLPSNSMDKALNIELNCYVNNGFFSGYAPVSHYYKIYLDGDQIISLTGKTAEGLGACSLDILDFDGNKVGGISEVNSESNIKYFKIITSGVYYIQVTPVDSQGALYSFILS